MIISFSKDPWPYHIFCSDKVMLISKYELFIKWINLLETPSWLIVLFQRYIYVFTNSLELSFQPEKQPGSQRKNKLGNDFLNFYVPNPVSIWKKKKNERIFSGHYMFISLFPRLSLSSHDDLVFNPVCVL